MAGRMQPLRALARGVTTRPGWIIAGALCAVVVGAIVGGGVDERLTAGGFFDEGSPSAQADERLEDAFGAGPANAAFVVDPVAGFYSGHVGDVAALMRALDEDPQVAEVLGPADPELGTKKAWPLGEHPLVGHGGRTALVAFTVLGDQDDVVEHLGVIEEELGGVRDGVEYTLTSIGPVSRAARETAERDLTRAELISAPATLAALLVVFGGLVAAFLPLVIAVVAIIGTFVVLTIITGFTDVSVFARTLTTALGLGLGIDYSLFVVSRYREELRSGHAVAAAVDRTLQTAGRTVIFSAATVAVSLAALFMFPITYLRSFAFAGIAVVALAAITAVVVLPAVLVALGGRIDSLRVRNVGARPADDLGAWGRQAQRVMRRPVVFGVGVTILLVAAALPFAGVQLTRIDDRVLPASAPERIAADIVRADYAAGRISRIEVVVADDRFGSAGDPARCRQSVDNVCRDLDAYARELFALDGVDNVVTENGAYVLNAFAFDALPVEPASGAEATSGGGMVDITLITDESDRLVADGVTRLSLIPAVEPISPEGEDLVRTVRRVAHPFDEVLITGDSARLVDTKSALASSLPWAVLWIAVSTFVVLLLMMGTPLIPLKALALNLLSLTATYGALVWIFQDGNLSGVLDVTATGRIDAFTPILLFCISFGLSMDYEVFLLSRIKEEYDLTLDNDRAVAFGLGRTGGIVTAAAVLLALVFGAIGTSGVAVVKMLGVGMVIAVLTDAFLIRATLVPAFMKLTGDANWWAPDWMRRLHLRYGIWEREPITIGPRPRGADTEAAERG